MHEAVLSIWIVMSLFAVMASAVGAWESLLIWAWTRRGRGEWDEATRQQSFYQFRRSLMRLAIHAIFLALGLAIALRLTVPGMVAWGLIAALAISLTSEILDRFEGIALWRREP